MMVAGIFFRCVFNMYYIRLLRVYEEEEEKKPEKYEAKAENILRISNT